MSTHLLLLIVLAAMTLLAYMIAINSRGAIRSAFSYLFATVILVGSVWIAAQYFTYARNTGNPEDLNFVEHKKHHTETQEKSSIPEYSSSTRQNSERSAVAARLNSIVATATGLATMMINTNLHDASAEFEELVAKSVDVKRRCSEVISDFNETKISDSMLSQSAMLVGEGLKQLGEASQYYYLYFRAEDSAQEALRERTMRQKARTAGETLQKASSLISLLISR